MDIFGAVDMRRRAEDAHRDLLDVKGLLEQQNKLLQQIVDRLDQST